MESLGLLLCQVVVLERFETFVQNLIIFLLTVEAGKLRLHSIHSKCIYSLLEYLVDENNNHDEIAKRLKKSRVNTTKLLNMANYQLFAEFIDLFEYLKSELIHE